jgi:hypothetical protein
MPLSKNRVLADGATPHPWEREAIEFLKQALPDSEPYRLWALVDLVDPTGRRHEIDALVLGYHALYLVEIKSHPGKISGDAIDWVFELPGGRRSLRENPMKATALKARVLASMLERQLGKSRPITNVSDETLRDIMISLPQNSKFQFGTNSHSQAGSLPAGDNVVVRENLFDPEGISKTGFMTFIVEYTDASGNRQRVEVPAIGNVGGAP